MWTPRFIQENKVYIHGSDIKGQNRLGAAVVHIPTCTTIYIDKTGIEETPNIMRVELVAIEKKQRGTKAECPRFVRAAIRRYQPRVTALLSKTRVVRVLCVCGATS
jgi:hypothetical protein